MPSFSKVVGEVVRPYYYYIIAAIAFIFFAVLAYFIYKNVFSKKKKNIYNYTKDII